MKAKFKIIFLFIIAFVCLGIAVSSCKDVSSERIEMGSVTAQLSWADQEPSADLKSPDTRFDATTLPDSVTTIRGIVSGSDMADVQKDFNVLIHTVVIDDIPVGSNRTVTMQGMDSSGNIRYQGVTSEITITANQTTDARTIDMTPCDVKEITAFSFTGITNDALAFDVTAAISETAISVVVPLKTNITALVATFVTIGESIVIGSTPQVNGVTVNDFSTPVIYTVTAIDSTTRDYTVTVTANSTIDSSTGKIWQDNGFVIALNWYNATGHCNGLELEGYSDWELPTKDELVDLYSRKNILKSYESSYYWSSTINTGDTSRVWRVDFSNGHLHPDHKGDNNYVRCVRGGQ
jgi:hypothetical protein